jgi:hypothetical protein
MKKIIPLLLTLTVLTACRNTSIDDELYDIAESVIRTIDAYMDNQISYEDANSKISGLHKQAEYWHDQHKKDNIDYTNSTTVYKISHVNSELYFEHSGSDTYADLKQARDELADHIGY